VVERKNLNLLWALLSFIGGCGLIAVIIPN